MRASAALAKASGAASGGVELRAGTIWYHTGRYVYNIRSADAGSDSVRDIRVFERDEAGRLVRLIHAARARRLAPHEWRFEGATVRVFDPHDPTAPPKVERSREVTLRLEEERSPRLLQAEIAALPVWTLAHHLDASPQDARARSLLHQRLTSPLLVLLFALLAVPLAPARRAHPQPRPPRPPGRRDPLPLPPRPRVRRELRLREHRRRDVAPWLIVAAFGTFGGVQLARVET